MLPEYCWFDYCGLGWHAGELFIGRAPCAQATMYVFSPARNGLACASVAYAPRSLRHFWLHQSHAHFSRSLNQRQTSCAAGRAGDGSPSAGRGRCWRARGVMRLLFADARQQARYRIRADELSSVCVEVEEAFAVATWICGGVGRGGGGTNAAARIIRKRWRIPYRLPRATCLLHISTGGCISRALYAPCLPFSYTMYAHTLPVRDLPLFALRSSAVSVSCVAGCLQRYMTPGDTGGQGRLGLMTWRAGQGVLRCAGHAALGWAPETAAWLAAGRVVHAFRLFLRLYFICSICSVVFCLRLRAAATRSVVNGIIS